MTTFTIDNDNNISASVGAPASADSTETFGSAKELAKLTAAWPAARLADTWNSFAGVAPFDELKPVKKFTDRKAAVARIWSAVQRLAPIAAEQAADVASEEAEAEKTATPPKKTAQAKKSANTKRVRKAKAATGAVREGSKKASVLALLQRPGGATLKEIMAATEWQAHSVRGFISGSLGKKMGIKVESSRREDGERVYQTA